jgi:hypothetical protein
MKTVLFVTQSPAHRKLYTRGLSKHFELVCVEQPRSLETKVDALVYDMDDAEKTCDLRWLESVDYPVVFLTSRSSLSLAGKRRSVLTYPVRMDDILRALAKLGVEPEPVMPDRAPSRTCG